MHCVLDGHSYINEIQTVIQIFFPLEKYTPADKISESGLTVVSKFDNGICGAAVHRDGALINERYEKAGKDIKLSLAAALFRTLKEIEPLDTLWGMMTGIRPTKKIYELLNSHNKEETVKYMRERYFISDEKLNLLFNVIDTQNEIMTEPAAGNGISLYIGIPFCRTRCLYCSFASDIYNEKKSLPYLNALYKELEFFSGLKPDTIYIGGGTPTSLNYNELESLLSEVNRTFPVKAAREFTVEAGRPDTLDEPKLALLKKYGVSRISINPQTLNQKTLERIGRGHTTACFYDAFELARKTGHDNINTDIILGLPSETIDDVRLTLEGLAKLEPEGLTVHTLAVKRASRLKECLNEYSLADIEQAKTMLKLADYYARDMKMNPYYLYRQKNMTGNLENVGYAKKSSECLYNVFIMEETQTIYAAGAGAVTKTVDTSNNRIERVFNVKNIDEYINRIDEMIGRKRGILL